MKNINIIIRCILLVGVMLIAGCKDEPSDYVNFSQNSYTFDAKGEEVIEIKVDAGKSWQMDVTGDWIEVQRDGNTLKISAEATKSNSVRTAQIVVSSGNAVETVTLSQLGTNVLYDLLDANSLELVISPNGKYIGGVNSTIVNNNYEFTPFVMDVATGQRSIKPVLKTNTTAVAISDNGVLVIMDEGNLTSQYYDSNNNLVTPSLPAGYSQPAINAISSDGRIMAGYCNKTSDRVITPIKWTDGVPSVLPIVTKTQLGEPITEGIMARGCSMDGSVIYGSIWDDYTAVYWKDGQIRFVAPDEIKKHNIIVSDGTNDYSMTVLDRPTLQAEKTNISANGRYIAFTYLEIRAVNKLYTPFSYPGVYDIENNKTTIIRDLSDGFVNGSGRTVDNDGTFSYSCPSIGSTNGYIYYQNTGNSVPTTGFIRDEYGVTLSTNESIIVRMTDDRHVILGQNILYGGSAAQFWYLNSFE